jgi:hypothetical protein
MQVPVLIQVLIKDKSEIKIHIPEAAISIRHWLTDAAESTEECNPAGWNATPGRTRDLEAAFRHLLILQLPETREYEEETIQAGMSSHLVSFMKHIVNLCI